MTETASYTPEIVKEEMDRIRKLFIEVGGGDREDLISYAKGIVRMRQALAPMVWLTNLHEKSRRGADDPDTTSIFVSLGALREIRRAYEQQAPRSIEEEPSGDDTATAEQTPEA